MGFLKLIGAVSAAEHQQRIDLAVARLESALVSKDETIERILTERDDANRRAVEVDARFKKAIKDLANATETIGDFKIAFDRMEKDRDIWRDQALRDGPDAQKWRDRAARELQRGQAKRDAAAKPLPVSKFTKPIPAPTKAVAAKGRK